MHTSRFLRGLAVAAFVSVMAASAAADIKSFNAAMKAKDHSLSSLSPISGTGGDGAVES